MTKKNFKETLINLINQDGLIEVIEIFGLEVLVKLLDSDFTKEMKIDAIIKFCEENDDWVNLHEWTDSILLYRSPNVEEDIGYLHSGGAVVSVWEHKNDSDDWEVVDEYDFWYGDLPPDILDKIFDIVLQHCR